MRPTKPDPYNGFKDDRERGVTLRSLHRWKYMAAMIVAAASTSVNWMEKIEWLKSFLPH